MCSGQATNNTPLCVLSPHTTPPAELPSHQQPRHTPAHLAVKGWVLNLCVDEHPEVVFDHEGLHVGRLALLVQLLNKVPD